MRFATLLLLALLAAPASAQFPKPTEPCPLGQATGTLSGLNVDATLFTNGNLFYDGTREAGETYYGTGYLTPLTETAPDGMPPSPIQTAALWVGGLVADSLRTAWGGYTTYSFRPGQIGSDQTPPSPEECAAADRVWVVSREDVERYYGGGDASYDLSEWPVHLGAPVLDGDGIEGNYDLAAGDQPAIRGDVMAFWVMNDAVAEVGPYPHRSNLPVGVDVAVEAFASNFANFGTETFYRFTLTNRNAVPLDSAYISMAGMWHQRRVARYLLGTDVDNRMLHVYSPYDPEEGQEPRGDYWIQPASGLVFVDGAAPEGQSLEMASSRYFYKSRGDHSFPSSTAEVYHAQQGRMNSGRTVVAYGEGFQPSNQPPYPETVYYWPGDPISLDGWSEEDYDNDGTRDASFPTSGRLGILSSNAFRLEPGASATVTFALAFAQGSDHFDSVRRLRQRARNILYAFEGGFFEPSRVTSVSQPVPRALAVTRPAPNPFTAATALTFTGVEGTRLTVAVYDALGREVRAPLAVEADGAVEVGDGLAPGVYLVRIAGLGFEEAFPVAKVQ